MGEELNASSNRGQATVNSQAPSPTRVTAADAPALTRRRGYVVVDEERCKGCELCVEVCPEDALEPSPSLNSFAYHPILLKEDNSCTGCALCAQVCPDVALEVYRE